MLATTSVVNATMDSHDSPYPVAAAAMSADGRIMVFLSNDGNTYLQNMVSGVRSKLAFPDGFRQVSHHQISADGSTLAFVGVQGNDYTQMQMWVMNLQTGTMQVASSTTSGKHFVGASFASFSLSGDGSVLAFSTVSENPEAGDRDIGPDVFVKNLKTGKLVNALDFANFSHQGASHSPQLSRDGNLLTFLTDVSGIGDSHGGFLRMVVKDLRSDSIRQANVDASGLIRVDLLPGASAKFSADGSKVVFSTGEGYDLYMKNLQNGDLQRISILPGGTPLTGMMELHGVSANGRYITFSSRIESIVAGDGDSNVDVYQKDTLTGQLQLLTPHSSRSGSVIGLGATDDGHTVLLGSTDLLILGDGALGQNQARSGTKLYLAHTHGLANTNGADTLFGTAGADQLTGGAGEDWYWVNNSADVVTEVANGGHDAVMSLLHTYTLPDHVEDLVIANPYQANVVISTNAVAIGNALGNRIMGNADANILSGMGGNDVLEGGFGNDRLDGGTGFDIAYFGDSFGSANISRVNGILQVSAPITGVDSLQNIERLVFSDQGFSLPGDTNAAQAYRIYQAAFNRTPDATGLGFWVKQIDDGASLTDVAKGFMQSAEFKAMYGAQPTNADMVNKFYQNVLHRAPDAGGLAFWTDVLNSGRGTAEYVLAQFAESPENQAALIGVTGVGFTFKPFG